MTTEHYKYNISVYVSKQTLDISFSDDDIRLNNDVRGFKQLMKQLIDRSATQVVMEATGGYERPLANYLQQHGIELAS